MGGGIICTAVNSTHREARLEIKTSNFMFNKADIGGGIAIQKGCNVTLVDSSFIDNIGSAAGSTIMARTTDSHLIMQYLTICDSNYTTSIIL